MTHDSENSDTMKRERDVQQEERDARESVHGVWREERDARESVHGVWRGIEGTGGATLKDAVHDWDSRIDQSNTFLVVLSKVEDDGIEELLRDFCGTVITDPASNAPSFVNKAVYLCGDLASAGNLQLSGAKEVFVVREFSHGHDESTPWPLVDQGRVPVLVHGVGVYYRRFFEPGDHFNRIRSEHAFQALTESTKPGTAHRTGIYLTPVEEDGEDSHFRLLRCSTNLSGPTEHFGAHDERIVGALNAETSTIFANAAPLNHVLAQVYTNTPATVEHKETKAKIKAHADKTKDMPRNGLMAFCTFYEGLNALGPMHGCPFDLGRRGISGLTRLHFRLKKPVAETPGCTLTPQFTITLFPDSVFFMPLSTNRLYTHEIRPPALDASLAPTRMGYVVRCSNAEAVHRGGETFLKEGQDLVKLEPPTPEGMAELRRLYAEENATAAVIEYTPTRFSMNSGDYARPSLGGAFRSLALPVEGGANLFARLLASVRWEETGKGRKGTVLVKADPARGVPIVRTTTKYAAPAHCFGAVHSELAAKIEALAGLEPALNNALIETYSNAYATMGLHSDQALDLQEGSHIALFSCYENPAQAAAVAPRKLVIESKEQASSLEIPLAHNSVVVWSTDTNRRFKHKIVLDPAASRRGAPENRWLGVTLRTSKTFVRSTQLESPGPGLPVPEPVDGGAPGGAGQPAHSAVLEDGAALVLADEGQRKEFYSLRRRENAEVDFAYPPLPYTISESDLAPPVPALPPRAAAAGVSSGDAEPGAPPPPHHHHLHHPAAAEEEEEAAVAAAQGG